MNPREAPRVEYSQLPETNKAEPYTWEEIQLINRYCSQTFQGASFTRNEQGDIIGFELYSVNAWCE
jgi:hypothetical protein